MAYPEQLAGVIPPVCTPFTADGEIDLASLESLIRYLIDGGVTGLFALGSTSECGAINDAQRRTILEATVKIVAGEVPVLAGVIAPSTATVIDYAREAEELGADAVVACGPYYIRPSMEETADHFRAIHAATSLPIMAYNVPFNVQTVLFNETMVQLAEEGVIVGVKDSSGNEPNFRALRRVTRHLPNFALFTGSEVTVDYAFLTGADGVVPGLGNVDPAGYRKLYDLCKAGDWDAAGAEQERLSGLMEIVAQATPGRIGFTSSALGGFKTALRELGVIKTNIMARPMMPLNEEEAGRVRDVLIRAGLQPK